MKKLPYLTLATSILLSITAFDSCRYLKKPAPLECSALLAGDQETAQVLSILREKYGNNAQIENIYDQDDPTNTVYKIQKGKSRPIAVKVQSVTSDGNAAKSPYEMDINKFLWEKVPSPEKKFIRFHRDFSIQRTAKEILTFIEMEYLPEGSLGRWMQNRKNSLDTSRNAYDFRTFQGLFESATEAVHGMHEQRLVHGDLKPENMLLITQRSILGRNKVHIVLIDFAGTATVGEYPSWQLKMPEKFRLWTPGYGRKDFIKDSEPAQLIDDLYSLSIVFRRLLCWDWINGADLKNDLLERFSPYSIAMNYERQRSRQQAIIPQIERDGFYKVLSVISWHQFRSTTELLSALKAAQKAHQKKDPAFFFRFFVSEILNRMDPAEREAELKGSVELNEFLSNHP